VEIKENTRQLNEQIRRNGHLEVAAVHTRQLRREVLTLHRPQTSPPANVLRVTRRLTPTEVLRVLREKGVRIK
jgi:hypothetical protein